MLIDTELLLVIVVGLATNGRVTDFKKTSSYEKRDFQRLLELARWPGVRQLVSPQILAELTNHADMVKGSLKRELFRIIGSFVAKHLEIYRPKDLVLKNPAFYPLGFADTSSLEVCRETGCVLVTSDFALTGIANSMGLQALNYRHFQGNDWFYGTGLQ